MIPASLRRFRAGLLASVLIAAVHARAAAQQVEPRIQVGVDTTTITLGARLGLTVAVEHDPSAVVQWPDSLDVGPFEVLEARAAEPVLEGDRAVSVAQFLMTAFELGELEIPSFDVRVVAADGTETVLPTDPFGIAVLSVGLDEGSDIRDVKGPLAIPLNVLLLWPWIVALLAAGGGGYWLARRARAKNGDGPVAVAVAPPRPPHEIALEALQWLEASPMLDQGRIKEYYIEVSDIIRRYVEGRYGIPALEMITPELVWHLEGAGIPPDVRARFTVFLEACDYVKFAKHRPDPVACGEIVPIARTLVELTPPAPEPEQETGTPAQAEGWSAEEAVDDPSASEDAEVETV